MVKPAPGGQLTPWKLVAPSTTSASSTSRCAPPFPCTPIPPLHACSMLTCLLLCHRSLLGRIFESKNISHIGVDSARRACHLRRGRARAREAVSRGLGRSVLCRVLCVSSSGAQAACAWTLLSHICELSRALRWNLYLYCIQMRVPMVIG